MAELDKTLTDTRPGIVICAWDADESGWDPVEDLSGEPWSPNGARTVPVPSADPDALASTLSAHLSDNRCRALLLVGPVADMVRALTEAGLIAGATSDAEEDAGSYLLYRVLSNLPDGLDTPAIGLLRAPENEPDAAVQRAVKAAAQAMARHLSPLPRSRAI
ncbi:MAG: hypothetical protein EON86_08875 [Brevundimonas sp.]|nr:MAG: hypothetical protein EON86_08875 [Brevundimonas sp.]